MSTAGVALVTSDFILDPFLDQVADELKRRGFDVLRSARQQPPAKTMFGADEIGHFFGRTEIVVTTTRSIISREALAGAPSLRAIVFPTIGTEAVDVAAANELGIAIAHGAMPENFNSMAEATILLMLALLYDMHGTERILRENLPRSRDVKARMLMGKTFGLVGLGRIGRAIVERLQAWDVNVLVFDPYVEPHALPVGARAADLKTVLMQSDVVSVHTTLTPETRHMIGDAELSLMKPSAFFLNTARGGMVDETALYRALADRRIAGAALDAFEQEPLAKDHPLRTLDNVILTPHMIGHTQEIFAEIPDTVMKNVDRVMRGEPPLYFRNPEVQERWQQRWRRLTEPA